MLIIPHNSRLLKISKLTRAATVITGNNIYGNIESVNAAVTKLFGLRTFLLLNIFHGPPGGLANTKDI